MQSYIFSMYFKSVSFSVNVFDFIYLKIRHLNHLLKCMFWGSTCRMEWVTVQINGGKIN